jgi:hypothetical protein
MFRLTNGRTATAGFITRCPPGTSTRSW